MSNAALTPLAAARASRGLSLAEVSKAVKYDRGGLSRIERGIARPRPALANKLVAFFDGTVNRDQIMYPEDYIAKPTKKPARSAKLQEVG